MRISLITDEYSQDPATAFELGKRWGAEHYEIRQAFRFRLPVAPAWAAQRAVISARENAVTITGISPGLFKPTMRTDGTSVPISCDNAAEIRRHLDELLPQFLDFAKELGAAAVTVFALPKPAGSSGAVPAVVIDSLAQAADRAGRLGFTLLLENGRGSYADSPKATAAILQGVNSPALQLVWDPANDVDADPSCDPLAGLDLLRPFLAGLHVKDIECVGGKTQWAMLGEGCLDWPRLIAQLRKSGYQGPFTLEPHLRYRAGVVDLVAMMEEFLARARGLLEG